MQALLVVELESWPQAAALASSPALPIRITCDSRVLAALVIQRDAFHYDSVDKLIIISCDSYDLYLKTEL